MISNWLTDHKSNLWISQEVILKNQWQKKWRKKNSSKKILDTHTREFLCPGMLLYAKIKSILSYNTISIPKEFIRNNVQQGKCPASPKAYRFGYDQALRLLCLNGHVRSRGSTLWLHRLIRSEWILVYEYTCWRESSNQIYRPTNPISKPKRRRWHPKRRRWRRVFPSL